MARMSYEATAKKMAKESGIELDDEGDLIEVWAYKAKLHNDAGGHSDHVHLEEFPTKAQQWKGVIESLKMFIEDAEHYTPDDCECMHQ